MWKTKIASISLVAYFLIGLGQLLWVEFAQQRLSVDSFTTQLNGAPVLQEVQNQVVKNVDLNYTTKVGIFEKTKNGNQFLWVTSSGEVIEVFNQNDQPIQSQLKLTLKENPCKKEVKLYISTKGFKSIVQISPLKQEIEIPLELGPREKQIIIFSPILSSTEEQVCRLENGDQRDFIAMISNLHIGDHESK